MSRKRSGARVLGPYPDRDGFRVVSVDAAGNRESDLFETEAKAEKYIEMLRASMSTVVHTSDSALDLYLKYLRAKGNKPLTIVMNESAIRLMLHESIPLSSLTPKRCEVLYDQMRERPTATGKPPAVDTHRTALARVKSFLRWCANPKQGFIRGNPAEDVKGEGKRRPRGKSLGKSGAELRVKEARVWYAKALELADGGDQGATVALLALLLGMRASEITDRTVGDIDGDEEPGDLLWIPCAKTPAGRRTLEVPPPLRPLLVAFCEGRERNDRLFTVQTPGPHLGKPHTRDWIRTAVHRVCDLAGVPRVTAHAMRGLLATITAERGLAGHLIAATLGHADAGAVAMQAYARPGSAAAGVNRRGLVVLNGGVQASAKSAK